MRIIVNILLVCLLPFYAHAQCDFKNTVFQAKESASYEVYYNLGFLWLNAGYAVFSVKDTMYNKNVAYALNCYGSSYEHYDWIFKVRDNYNSIINPENCSPYSFSRQTSEGGYLVSNTYQFSLADSIIQSNCWNNESFRKIKSLEFTSCTFDVLSAIYACRTIDFNNRQINETIPLQIIIDGEIANLHIRYLGKEVIKNRDERIFHCNKFSVLLVEGTIFKGGEDMFVWISDDKNQIPVYVEAKILVGSIKGMLKDYNAFKWPANYRVYSNP